jgi:hypothetical protein
MGQQLAACKLTIAVDGDHCRAFVKLLANLMDFAVDVLDVARDQPEQPFSRRTVSLHGVGSGQRKS